MEIMNTGDIIGKEVVQVYIENNKSSVYKAKRELKQFKEDYNNYSKDNFNILTNEIYPNSIKKIYSSETLEVCGQKIGVLLPFSNGEYYEEYLVNTKTIIREFKDNGFQLIENTSISSKLQEFNLSN